MGVMIQRLLVHRQESTDDCLVCSVHLSLGMKLKFEWSFLFSLCIYLSGNRMILSSEPMFAEGSARNDPECRE